MHPIYRFELGFAGTSTNLLDPNVSISNRAIMQLVGGQVVLSNDPNYKTTDYLTIPGGGDYHLINAAGNGYNWGVIAWFDSSKSYIGLSSVGASSITFPSNAKYFRLSLAIGANLRQLCFSLASYGYQEFGKIMHAAHPIYKDDLAIDYELQSNEQFYRAKLSGKLTFERDDYSFIVGKVFDTQFYIHIFISYDAGQTWAKYWGGMFWKTDCEFDINAQTVIVAPTVDDSYNDVLAGLEKEFNLIDLAPSISPIHLDKRSMIQVYVPGQTAIGCFLSGMWWEQECDAVNNVSNLTNKYHFTKNIERCIIDVTAKGTPNIPDVFFGTVFDPEDIPQTVEFTNGGYKLQYISDTGSGGSAYYFYIVRISDNQRLWYYASGTVPVFPHEFTLAPYPGSGATGNVKIYVHNLGIYARRITDVVSAEGISTYAIDPNDDLVPDNRNYTRIAIYNFPDSFAFSDALSTSPTKWGLYKPGQYYQSPSTMFIPEWFPVARAGWGAISYWFAFSAIDWLVEEKWRKDFELKDAYPLWSVISVLLGQIAPGITHGNNTDYSEFLYTQNPITGNNQRLFITPKSNLLNVGYDQPAQKAMITLRDVLNMLRDCFRCYWFIDSENRFRIEHILWFRKGGRYGSGLPSVGIDLTAMTVSRNGKSWAFGREQYQFDKPDMAARYQFGWMDDVTELFEGFPIDIISRYVNPDNIEQIDISKFTSDVDYIMLNPADISPDGFVLLAPVYDVENDIWKLPYVNFDVNDADHILQNPFVAFIYLQQYYAYDMPAYRYKINGVNYWAEGIKKLKKQTIKFPVLTEPNLTNLVKTNIGDGTIEKMSVNLSSRNANATLKYDTE